MDFLNALEALDGDNGFDMAAGISAALNSAEGQAAANKEITNGFRLYCKANNLNRFDVGQDLKPENVEEIFFRGMSATFLHQARAMGKVDSGFSARLCDKLKAQAAKQGGVMFSAPAQAFAYVKDGKFFKIQPAQIWPFGQIIAELF